MSFRFSGVLAASEIKMSISVPLLFAVPLTNDPLGAIPTRYLFAHCAMMGRRTVSAPRTGESGPVFTSSRRKMPAKYWFAFIRTSLGE
jgi:hypothetical protein